MINQRFIKKIQNISYFKFIIFSFLTAFIYMFYNLLLNLLFYNYFNSNSPTSIILNSTFLSFYSVLIAPFIETFFYQFIIIKLFKKFFKNYFLGILVSALIFNISHNFPFWAHIAFIPISLFFPYIFYIYDEVDKNPFIKVTFIHFSINLLIFAFYKLNLYSF